MLRASCESSWLSFVILGAIAANTNLRVLLLTFKYEDFVNMHIYLTLPYLPYLTYLPYLPYLHDLPCLPDLSYLPYLPYLPYLLTYLPYLLYLLVCCDVKAVTGCPYYYVVVS